MNIITTITGRANQRTSTSELFVFLVPQAGMRVTVETFLGKAVKEMRTFSDTPVRAHGQVQVIPSISTLPPEIGGKFATASYNVDDNVIVKIVGKRRSGWQRPLDTTLLYVRCRKGAAYRTIRMDCVPSNALSMPYLEVSGNFDMLTVDEVKAFGGKVNQMSETIARNSDRNIFTITVKEPEKQAPVKMVEVEKADGSKTLVPVVKRRRMLER